MEDFKVIKNRLELSEALREKHEDAWKRYRHIYENNHYGGGGIAPGGQNDHRVTVPFITGLIRTIIPSVFTRSPKWFVTARKAESKINVPTVEKVIDYFWNELKMQKIAKLALLDNLVVGYSAVFCAYVFVTKDKTQKDHTSFKLTKDGDEVLVDRKVIEDRPHFERLDPITDVLIDPVATTLNPYNGRYVIRVIRKTLGEVKRRYPRAKIEADSTIKEEYIDKNDFSTVKKFNNDPLPQEKDDDKKMGKTSDSEIVTLYEYWTSERRVLFTKGAKKPIVDEENPYFNEIPIIFSENYERMSSAYPIGEVEMAQPMTEELDLTRSQIINHRKRFNRKYGIDKEKVDDEGMQAFQNPEDGTIVATEGDPSAAIKPISDAPISQDVYANERSVKADFQFIMANFDYSRGGRQTATEVREISDSTFSRRKEKMQVVEDLSTDMIEKLVKLLQYGWEKKDVIAYVGDDDGTTEWVDISPDKLKGDFIFKFQQGSTEPLNEELMMKRALDTYNLLAGDQTGNVDQLELQKWVLQTLKIQNIDKILPGQPDPGELVPGGALPGPEGELIPGQEGAVAPVATQLPRRPANPGVAQSNAALAGGEPTLANILRGGGL